MHANCILNIIKKKKGYILWSSRGNVRSIMYAGSIIKLYIYDKLKLIVYLCIKKIVEWINYKNHNSYHDEVIFHDEVHPLGKRFVPLFLCRYFIK